MMKYLTLDRLERNLVTRIVIRGWTLSTEDFYLLSKIKEKEDLQLLETTGLYSIFKNKNGDITFVVKVQDGIEKIDPEIFTGIENVSEIIISGVLVSHNSKAPLPDTILELPKLRSVILDAFDATIGIKKKN